jgi:stress response protein YsnF
VPYEKDRVKDAPSVDPDAQLSGEEEDRLYRHYGVDDGRSEEAESEVRDTSPAEGETDARAAEPEAEAGADAPPADRDVAEGGGGMIRSEEEVHIGTRRRATSRARLKKYVVTEQVKKVVPVQREEVRVEYDPADGEAREVDDDAPVRDDARDEGEARRARDDA